MARRITQERVERYLAYGSTGALAILGVMALILNLGVATVDSYDANTYCGGSVACWVVLNNTCFNEDVFVYPMDNPAALINGDPSNAILDAKMHRSWGSGWREFKMNETCTGTWCGAPDNKGVSYVVAFREGRCYDLKFEVWKPENATVSWQINPTGEWLALDSKPLSTMEIRTVCETETLNYTVTCNLKNLSCTEKDEGVFYYNVTKDCKEILILDNKTVDFQSQGLNCKYVKGGVVDCDQCTPGTNKPGRDGNCDGVCQSGETCTRFQSTGEVLMKNSEENFPLSKGSLTVTPSYKVTDYDLKKASVVDDKEEYKAVLVKETAELEEAVIAR